MDGSLGKTSFPAGDALSCEINDVTTDPVAE